MHHEQCYHSDCDSDDWKVHNCRSSLNCRECLKHKGRTRAHCPKCDGTLELTEYLQHNWGVYTCEDCETETQGSIILADILDEP